MCVRVRSYFLPSTVVLHVKRIPRYKYLNRTCIIYSISLMVIFKEAIYQELHKVWFLLLFNLFINILLANELSYRCAILCLFHCVSVCVSWHYASSRFISPFLFSQKLLLATQKLFSCLSILFVFACTLSAVIDSVSLHISDPLVTIKKRKYDTN